MAQNRYHRTSRIRMLVGLAAVPLALVACNKSGTGIGVAKTPGERPQQVSFRWNSGPSSLKGRISTTLPDGSRYSGRFMEITSTTTVAQAYPFYGSWYWGWSPTWDDWGGPYYGYPPGVDAYITHYSGRVLATLRGSKGDLMHCVFRLEEPSAGLSGGGMGSCKTSEGTTIQPAAFQPHA